MKNKRKKKPGDYITVRIWPKTREKLRIASALTGKPMVAIMDEIVKKYLDNGQANLLAELKEKG